MSTPGSQTLAQFQTVVQQQEQIFGPLTALGKEGTNNTMTFDVGTSPAQGPELATYTDATPPAKSGHTIVCTGDCLVEGKAAKVVAYRKA
jgi:hypothetical protein